MSSSASLAKPSGRNLIASTAMGLFAMLVYSVFVSILPSQWRAPSPGADYLSFYEPVAHNILAGKGYVTPDGQPGLRYPPGFPLALAGTFAAARLTGVSDDFAVRLLIAFSTGVTAILVYLIAAKVFGSRAGIIAAILWSTYPFQLWLTQRPDSGHVFNIPFLSAVYVLLIVPRGNLAFPLAFVSGLLLGAGSLVRPIGIALGVVFCCGLWILESQTSQKRRAILAGLLVFGNIVAVMPWELWAHRVSGRWIPLSTNGPASMLDGFTFSTWRLWRTQMPMPTVPVGVRNLIGEYVTNATSLSTTSGIWEFTLDEAVKHPLAMTELLAIKTVRAWYASDFHRFEAIGAILQVPYILFFACGMSYSRKRTAVTRDFTRFILLLVIYFWLMTIITLSILRYMLPALALIMMCPAYLLSDRFGVFDKRGPGRFDQGSATGLAGKPCLAAKPLTKKPIAAQPNLNLSETN